jgi:hypothetical protein
MKGYNIAEDGHVVNILPPVDVNGGVSSDVFSMKDAAHVDIIVQVGVSAAAPTITVEECDNFTPTTPVAIGFDYYAETTAGGDTLAARATATNAGFAISANDNIFYVISIDASELSRGYPNLRITFSNPGASVIASAVAILSGYRFKGSTTQTEIA